MEYSRMGNNSMTCCPCCDELIVFKATDDDHQFDKLDELMKKHRADSPKCEQYFRDLPTFESILAKMQPHFEKAEAERQQRITENPDNGRLGYWLVEGIRHEARTLASSAAEAIAKCAGEVGDWETPSATFIGKELPDVF